MMPSQLVESKMVPSTHCDIFRRRDHDMIQERIDWFELHSAP